MLNEYFKINYINYSHSISINVQSICDRCSIALVHNHCNINLTHQKKKMKEVQISSHALFSRPRAFIWLKNIKSTIYTKLLDDRIRMFPIYN